MEIFDLSRPLMGRPVEGGLTDGFMRCDEDDESFSEYNAGQSRAREPANTDYARKYQQREAEETANCLQEPEREVEGGGGLVDIDRTTMCGGVADVGGLSAEATADIFKRYDFARKKEVDLPIFGYKQEIMETMTISPVMVIVGPTGCGKTTQVPQFVLDECWENGRHCNIVVTQPRRIGAVTIAERVCAERGWDVGTVCGYKIGLHGKVGEDTRLQYVTTGVLLQRIIATRSIADFSHIFIDEIHERTIEMDFLLLIIRKLMRLGNTNTKVILMSATVDSDKFCKYFRSYNPKPGFQDSAPLVTVEATYNRHHVDVFYLDDLIELTPLPVYSIDKPMIAKEAYDLCVNLLELLGRNNENYVGRDSVLIFLPGIAEIEEVNARIRKLENAESNYDIVPLHSTLPAEQQGMIFRKPPTGKRRIILATNIAESSITIPDVKYVIDFCLTKIQRTDPVTNYSGLELAWASRSNLDQRRGRVGRVAVGRVYRFINEEMFLDLAEDAVPEMLCQSMENVVLRTKMMDMGSPKELLALAIDPPNLSNIEATVLTLKEVGGLMLTCNGSYDSCDGDLSHLGRLMASLPVDVRITKLIALGYALGVFESTIIIGAAMANKSVFTFPFEKKMNSYRSLVSWAYGTMSDHLAFLNVFQVYKQKLLEGGLDRPDQFGVESWARGSFLQLRVLRDVALLVDEITGRLKNHQMEIVGQKLQNWKGFPKNIIIKLAIAGAFYPNYYGRNFVEDRKDSAMRILSGHEPRTCVYLTGFPPKQPGPLYAQRIKRLLKDCATDMNVYFEQNTLKTYVDFRPESQQSGQTLVSSHIAQGVYNAVLMRKMKANLKLKILPTLEAQSRAESLGLFQYDLPTPSEACSDVTNNLPGVDSRLIGFKVTKVVSPDHFFAQSPFNEYNAILETINNQHNKLSKLKGPPEVGLLYIAQLEPDTHYERVRVLNVPDSNVRVLAIDQGGIYDLPKANLRLPGREISDVVRSIPACSLEVRLACVQAPLKLSGNRVWSKVAVDAALKFLHYPESIGEIYSVVEGVVRVKLFAPGAQMSFNEYLIDNKLADEADEDVRSIANHQLRLRTDYDPNILASLNASQLPKYWKLKPCVTSPPESECPTTVILRGPYSPLEVSLYPMVRIGGQFTTVNVGTDSVNTVILDDMVGRCDDLMLIASHVAKNPSGTGLTISQTTLLPPYPGIAALICLIFAPRVEYRKNKLGSRYASATFGLGTDARGVAIYPEHDFNLTFSTHFSQEDLEDVNILRQLLSTLLDKPDQSVPDLTRLRNNIEKAVSKLLLKRRSEQVEEAPTYSCRWSQIPVELRQSDHCGSILPDHPLLELEDEKELYTNIMELISMCENKEKFEPTLCIVCNTRIPNYKTLYMHLATKTHKEAETCLLELKKPTVLADFTAAK